MTTPLIEALSGRHGLPTVDAETVDPFLQSAEPALAVLFFTGDPKQRPEANDVAVVLPELLASFPDQLAGAVVSPAAQAELKARFAVRILPSLVLVRNGEAIAAIPKIQDWSIYRDRITAVLDGTPPPGRVGRGPKTEFTINGGRAA